MFKRLFSNTEEEEKVLAAIKESNLQTMRVVGRGTLVVNTREVTKTDKFRKYAELAEQIVHDSKG